MEKVVLGRTGIEVSRLCIGTGTSGIGGASNQTRKLGHEGLVDLLVYAHSRGITWFDTADQYGTHVHVGEAMRRIGREKVVITTKTIAQTGGWVRKDLDRFRRELDTDYIDIVLLHCLMHPWWSKLMRPVMKYLSELKEKGVIRAVGCSNHNFGALKAAAAEPWVDVVLARINPWGKHMEARPDQVLPVLQKMHDDGKGIYGMKVLGAGDMRDKRREAFAFQLGLKCVDAFVVGMESKAEVDENLELLSTVTAPV